MDNITSIKFIYSEKATKFDKISILILKLSNVKNNISAPLQKLTIPYSFIERNI